MKSTFIHKPSSLLSTKRVVGGFVIESGVPVPPLPGGQPAGPINAAINSLEVGDSFVVPEWKEHQRQHAHTYAKRKGKKIKTRVVQEGLRIWRIE